MNLDISKELCIAPHLSGIRVIAPSLTTSASRLLTVGEVLDYPCNVYFLNSESVIENINESSVEICGYDSIADAMGRSVHDLLAPKDAIISINDDKEVLSTKRIKLYEHSMEVLGLSSMNCFSVKVPVFNKSNHIVGVFGCTVVIGLQPLTQTLQLINKIGLLRSTYTNNKLNDASIFSNRETEVLQQLVRGKSAKQIADCLYISKRTVEHHIENMKIKAQCSSKYELIELYGDIY